MATRTVEAELGTGPSVPTPISLAWMPRKLTAAASDSLDLIRAIAAFAVMVGHLRALFFADFAYLQSKSLPLGALYFFTGFGHQAVIVFFVLSGSSSPRPSFEAMFSESGRGGNMQSIARLGSTWC